MRRLPLLILLPICSILALAQSSSTLTVDGVAQDPTKTHTIVFTPGSVISTVPPPQITMTCSAYPASVAAGATVQLTATAQNTVPGDSVAYTWAGSGFTPSAAGVVNTTGLAAGSYTAAGKATETLNGAVQSTAACTITFQVTASAPPPTGTALSACQPITASGTYYLANDVTCGNQSFALNANGITLNLNGHTINYGSTTQVAPAITICDNWYSNLPAANCGNGAHGTPTIYGGKIIQVKGTTPFTHAIWIGQGNGIKAGAIHDLNITIQEPGAQAIFGDYPGAGWKIQNNVINDGVTNIEHPSQGPLSARSQFQGMVIQLNNGSNSAPASGVFDVISGNTINGSPQGGIYDTNQNAQIYSNQITLSSAYSNDYGVLVLADGQYVHDNVISGRGRGLDAESSDFLLYNNTINVHEEANNSEYNGCELAGSDGIRIKNYAGNVPTTNGAVKNNTITVSGQYCEANGIALTQLTGGSLTLSGNSVTVVPGASTGNDTAGAGSGYYDVRYDNVTSGASITWSGNSFVGDIPVYFDWTGSEAIIQSGQKWKTTGTYGAVAIDGGSSVAGYPISLTVQDALPSTKVFCGANSTALVKIGSASTQCGH